MMRVRSAALFNELCRTSGVTQSALAAELGYGRPFVSDVKNGYKRIDELDAAIIARALGVRVGVLFETAAAPSRVARYSA